MYSTEDHSDLLLAHDLLHWSSELINGVMERRRLDLNMQAVSFFAEAKQDADLGDRAIAMGERYMGWVGDDPAAA